LCPILHSSICLLTHLIVPISAVIITGALSFALSTRVRSFARFALDFILNPFDDSEPEKHGPKRKRKLRSYRHASVEEDYGFESDFWKSTRDKHDEVYGIPVHNVFSEEEKHIAMRDQMESGMRHRKSR
jgi:hypothetical protein